MHAGALRYTADSVAKRKPPSGRSPEHDGGKGLRKRPPPIAMLNSGRGRVQGPENRNLILAALYTTIKKRELKLNYKDKKKWAM